MPPTIRAFEPGDIAAARALWQAAEGVGLSPADEIGPLSAFLARNPGLSQVAEAGGRLAGAILVGHDGRRGYIHHLAVAESHRRQGLARALVAAGLAALAREGIGKCHLFVFEANADGGAFWAALGAERRVDLGLWSITL